MKIKVIYPTMEDLDMQAERDFMSKYFSKGTEFDIQLLDYGSISVESEYDVSMATPDILKKIKEAEEKIRDMRAGNIPIRQAIMNKFLNRQKK